MADEKARQYMETQPLDNSMAYANNFSAHRPGITPTEATQIYDQWATEGYEQDLGSSRYRGPAIAAKAVADFFPPSQRPNVRILDVAAGSGFVGEELRKLSFMRMDALDPSPGMLELARKKDVYDRYFCCYLNDQRLPIEDNFYDCSVTSGGMGEGHIPVAGLYELARIVKPGGLVCIVMRAEYLQHVPEYSGRLELLMDQMEENKVWRRHSRTVVPRYSFDNDGVVFRFVIC